MSLAKSDRAWMSGLAGEGLVTIGDPRLKAPVAVIDPVTEAHELLDAMVTRLRSLNGAGLAAPQVGVSARVVVVEVRKTDVFPDRPETPLVEMINPVIVRRSPADVLGWEGCFSVPGIMGVVPRSFSVVVTFAGRDGAETHQEFTGYAARVVQHEVDHLDGYEFVDRMGSMASLTTVQNYLDHRRDDPSWVTA
ncbi:peptide deformylase [Hamadaea sp. NPDC050747]|uniref:peptide deformylase n=1 Tax=Hamadaea sp. NPDC050747 TaxID=3155789 RepID=UPI0033CC58D2